MTTLDRLIEAVEAGEFPADPPEVNRRTNMTDQNDDWVQGYLDGRCPGTPTPSDNRSAAYRHSFDVGRREITGRVLTANAYRMRAEKADAVERLARDG